jgi:hypothetical protein
MSAPGLEPLADYPYTAADGNCAYNSGEVVAKISDWTYTTTDQDEHQMVHLPPPPRARLSSLFGFALFSPLVCVMMRRPTTWPSMAPSLSASMLRSGPSTPVRLWSVHACCATRASLHTLMWVADTSSASGAGGVYTADACTTSIDHCVLAGNYNLIRAVIE